MISLEKSALPVDPPTEVFRTVATLGAVEGASTPRVARRLNADLRTREHLTPGEVETLIETAKANRHGHRDATMILVAFRHGLRAAEVCDLRWDQIDFSGAVLHVRRVKNGTPSTHPLLGDELRGLTAAAAREPAVAIRLRQRARHAIHDRGLCSDDRAGRPTWSRPEIEGSPAHASPRLR